jgi:polygalacturonase
MRSTFFILLLFIVYEANGAYSGSPEKNVLDYGADPEGFSLSTEAIQQCIDACAVNGGGRVIIPPGVYRSGPLYLKSNIHVEILAGARLMMDSIVDNYTPVEGVWEGIRRKIYPSLFIGYDLQNIAISGMGIIDGQGKTWWDLSKKTKEIRKEAGILKREPENPPGCPLKWPRPRVINLYRCSNVLIRDITILNSPAWTIHPVYCKNVTIDRVSIIQPYESPNTDGINPESCKDVRITNCYVDCGDDCIAIKSGYNEDGREVNIPSENIIISNCTFAHGRSAVGIGSETSGGVRNVVISNCVFMNTFRGLRIKTGRGRGNTVENIRASNIIMQNIGTGISIDMYYDDDDENMRPVDETTPFLKNISYSHITGTNVKKAGMIYGLPEAPVSGLTLTDVNLNAESGMEFKYLEGLYLKDIVIKTSQGAALEIRNSADIIIERFRPESGCGGKPPIIVEEVTGCIIHHAGESDDPD